MKSLLLIVLMFSAVGTFFSQSDLSPFAGNWKMTPSNPTHSFSGINIVNNGATVTIKLKKSPFKTFTARMNPQSNRLEAYIDQKGYYFTLGQGNSMSLYQIYDNVKIGDYLK